ncbi:T9SS type A sorting domain-containing protein [Taibaiella soli]|uniref:Secretion system C-terminal sorting domain-containing protein n=1 Tax=Taibaiella soli TaxID=1649169 RepID=A0A2W2AEG6_9BACT|nr:T9SS type A sorting domain-containing protein [Taibaiella soli]PZF73681.1 hypothetical protein DN068_06695 [Taibaiella soli]
MKKNILPRNAIMNALLAAAVMSAPATYGQRAYNLIYSQNLKGGHTMFGNTSMAIYNTTSGNLASGATVNTTAMNDFGSYGNGETSQYGNDNSNMQFVNVDWVAAYTDTLIDLGSTWKETLPTSEPSGWEALSFNDASWSNYTGATPLTGSSTRNTAYFRIKFNVTNPSAYTNFTLNLKDRQGAVVYLNGSELNGSGNGRDNITSGNVTFSTGATLGRGTTSGNVNFTIPSSSLVAGQNIITVEVHRRNQGSNDQLALDARLTGAVPAGSSVNNASSADLVLPSTGTNTVKFARLYWGGRVARTAITANAANLKTVKLRKGSSGSYANVTALGVDTIALNEAAGVGYQSYADVTSFINSNGAGTYTVADIVAATGGVTGGNFAGWSIVVVYENSAQTDYYSTRIYDGYMKIYSGGSSTTVPVTLNGFDAPSGTLAASDAYLTAFAWEGDANLAASSSNPAGDFLQINGNAFTDANNPASNIWNGTISTNGTMVTTKNPNYKNQFGIDIDQLQVGTGYGIQPNASQVAITFGTEADQYFPSGFAFSLRMKPPVVSIAKTATGNKQTPPNSLAKNIDTSEIFTYTISGTNSGQGVALGTMVIDSIPANSTYVPGSLNIVTSGATGVTGTMSDASGDDYAFLGTAANGRKYVMFYIGSSASATAGGILESGGSYSVQFKVQAPATYPALGTIANIAYVSATAQSGEVITNQASFVINQLISVPLAVNLTNFGATKSGTTAIVNWTTVNEKDNDYFELQRSTDGAHFSTVATVKGNGTTTVQHSYEYRDALNEVKSNTVYYRLYSVAFDGSKTTSKVIAVNNQSKISDINIYPNPFAGSFKVDVYASEVENVAVRIKNMVGQILAEKNITVQSGLNTLGIEELNGVPQGMYIVEVAAGGDVVAKKMIKQ